MSTVAPLEELKIEVNEILASLPPHLLQYVKPQHYERYTQVDQAVWRYVMKRNFAYLNKVAHSSYLDGLSQTGIDLDRIPSMYGMNRILQRIGWAAVAVDGLIPTSAFLEFQAYNVLVIASEIRTLEDIEYTPIPDIIHESAGHAPIIANAEYAEFLRRLGQIGCKAISSSVDNQLDEAVRNLTLLKEKEDTTAKEIHEAEESVRYIQGLPNLSEMRAIRNLHWWSVEYGLIGTPVDFRIYGAGLLSSIGESKWCMSEKVAKLPYSLDSAICDFDYTKPQPQLFVTPDFAHLSYVVEEYADQMALRKGGQVALEKLQESSKLGTIELSTGIQISGRFTDHILDPVYGPVYFQTSGPTALSYREKELIGHGISTYKTGFGSPIGKLKGINIAIEDMSPRDLDAYNIYEGRKVKLAFEGGILVEGEVITGIRNLQGKILLIRFKHCIVKHLERVLFHPDWGVYNMAIGKEIVSGYAGPADINSFDLVQHKVDMGSMAVGSVKDAVLEKMYEWASPFGSPTDDEILIAIQQLQSKYDGEWLLLLNWRKKLSSIGHASASVVEDLLDHLKHQRPEVSHLIEAGL